MFPTTINQAGIRYGVITGSILAVFSWILMSVGPVVENPFGIISYILLIVGIYLGHKYFKDHNDQFMTYGQGLWLGVLISVIAGVLYGAGSFIYIKFIDNTVITIIMDAVVVSLEEQGTPDDVIDTMMGFMEVLISPMGILIMGLLEILFMGFIFSLVISAFTKKDNLELPI